MLIIPLWYQNVLIFTTLLITIVIFLFKDDYLLIFQFFIILSYRFQYTGENYHFFLKHYEYHYILSFGRFIETFPHSLTGFFLAVFSIPNKLKKYKKIKIIIGIIILIFISKYNIDKNLIGFKYGGIRLNIAGVLIFLIFYSIDNIKNINYKNILDIITNFTAGIYFLHF